MESESGCDFPTLTRDLWMIEDYEEAYCRFKSEKRRAIKQWSRDYVMESYGIGINNFYALQKRVTWILSFSGGQIENIARKQLVNAVLTGEDKVDLETIQEACKTELFKTSTTRRIGFC